MAKEPSAPAPTTVCLKNRTKRPMLFNLPHAEYCVTACACKTHERVIEEYDYKNKAHVAKVVERRICSSVSWSPGETLELSLAVLGVKDVIQALASNQLVKI